MDSNFHSVGASVTLSGGGSLSDRIDDFCDESRGVSVEAFFD